MSDLQATAEVVQTTDAPADAALHQDAEPSTQDTEASGADETTPVEAKTYSEEEVRDRIERATAKAAAKAERRAFREAAERFERMQQAPTQQRQVDEKPQRLNGEADDSYLDRLTDWKLEQRDKQGRQHQEVERVTQLKTKTEAIYAQAEKEPGFDRDEFDALPITPAIAQAITESDVAPKLMAYLTANPDDLTRFAKLSPARQAVEIGKLEVSLASAKPSRAAPPITPIGGRGAVSTDPNKMTNAEYDAWRRSPAGR